MIPWLDIHTPFPDVSRALVRERGSAAIARATLSGWAFGLQHLARTASDAPTEARLLALEIAAVVADVPALTSHRLRGLHELERALDLPAGSAGQAIEAARRIDRSAHHRYR